MKIEKLLKVPAHKLLLTAFAALTFQQAGAVDIKRTMPADTSRIQREDEIYRLRDVPIPQGLLLEVGGMTFLPNDALAVATRRGEIWVINNPYMKNGRLPTYKLFAQGMHEVLGLNYINGDVYCVQRSELTRLRDLDGDGEADE